MTLSYFSILQMLAVASFNVVYAALLCPEGSVSDVLGFSHALSRAEQLIGVPDAYEYDIILGTFSSVISTVSTS